jgi:hypothetical protein
LQNTLVTIAFDHVYGDCESPVPRLPMRVKRREMVGQNSPAERAFSPFRPFATQTPCLHRDDLAAADSRCLNRFSALMESATLWKVDATEAGLRADAGLDRFP